MRRRCERSGTRSESDARLSASRKKRRKRRPLRSVDKGLLSRKQSRPSENARKRSVNARNA
jgi:hypothetical protein